MHIKQHSQARTVVISIKGWLWGSVMHPLLSQEPWHWQQQVYRERNFLYRSAHPDFGENLDEHGLKFHRLMKRLAAANLMIEPKKCQFLKREARVLGHIVGGEQIKTDRSKIAVLKNYSIPTNAKKVKQFLGLAGYYRRFVRDFAKIATPLSHLLRKNLKFEWKEEQMQAFRKLIKILSSKPVLITPELTQPFIVTTDASDFEIGAALSQGKLGDDPPFAYTFRC